MILTKDFYPTPNATIEKMVDGLNFDTINTILDIGAGTGNITDYLKEKYCEYRYRGYNDFDVIEINTQYQNILKAKEYRLVHDDFLTFDTHKKYDLIIGNLPFSIGAQMLANALRLLKKSGGHLRLLVNAETIRNPYSMLRQELLKELEELNAEIEYFEDEFIDAERPTKVEVALIKAYYQPEEKFSVVLDSLRQSEEFKDEFADPNQLVTADFYQQLFDNFNFEMKVGLSLIREYNAAKPFIMDEIDYEYKKPIIEMSVGKIDLNRQGDTNQVINQYLKKLRHKYWNNLIRSGNFRNQFTSNILKGLDNKITELANYDFTLFNIQQLEEDLRSKIIAGINDAILEMFNEFSCKFAWNDYNDNIHYYNGWKTNKAYKINEKVIIPMNGTDAGYGRGRRWSYYISDRIHDIFRVFDYFRPDEKLDSSAVSWAMRRAEENQRFELEFRHLRIKFYKKGTAHIYFLDKELLDKFNIYGSQKKGWLPPSYAKVAYEDLDPESKAVIDEFQGEAEYRKVYNNPSKYLLDTNKLLLSA